MTDAERKKLIAALYRTANTGPVRVPICGEAADEIERLEKEVARLKDEYGILQERMTNLLDSLVQ